MTGAKPFARLVVPLPLSPQVRRACCSQLSDTGKPLCQCAQEARPSTLLELKRSTTSKPKDAWRSYPSFGVTGVGEMVQES